MNKKKKIEKKSRKKNIACIKQLKAQSQKKYGLFETKGMKNVNNIRKTTVYKRIIWNNLVFNVIYCNRVD